MRRCRFPKERYPWFLATALGLFVLRLAARTVELSFGKYCGAASACILKTADGTPAPQARHDRMVTSAAFHFAMR